MTETTIPETDMLPATIDVSPAVAFKRATDVAGVCGEIVKRTAKRIGRKDFVPVEGWEAIATAHGCCAGAGEVDRVYDKGGQHIGWTAKGYIRTSQGIVVSTGEGYVGKDEKHWQNSEEYACRAMAQTRAISRACRSAFAHVIVLIDKNLSTTPAEEVPAGGFDDLPVTHRSSPRKVSPPSISGTVDGASVDDVAPAREPGSDDDKERVTAPDEDLPPGHGAVTGTIMQRKAKEGESRKGPWKKWSIALDTGEKDWMWLSTFQPEIADLLRAYKEGDTITVSFVTDAKGYHNLTGVKND